MCCATQCSRHYSNLLAGNRRSCEDTSSNEHYRSQHVHGRFRLRMVEEKGKVRI